MPSLYANLLDPKAAEQSTISSAPVKYEFTKKVDETSVQEGKKADAALRFQPVRRPQTSLNKSKKPQSAGPKRLPTTSNKPIRDASTAADAAIVPAEGNTTSGIDKWKNDNDEVEDPYAAEYLRHKEEEKQRQRWANKKRKKKAQDAGRWVDFEQIYDPEVPTRLDDYKGSDEQANAEHEWKQLLHAHQMKKKQRTPSPEVQAQQVKTFAPPRGYNFAPPPAFDDGPAPTMVRPPPSPPRPSSPPRPAASVNRDNADPYLQRMRLSQTHNVQSDHGRSAPSSYIPPNPSSQQSAPPSSTSQTQLDSLSAAPIRYTRPDIEDEPTHAGLGSSLAANDEQANDDALDEQAQQPPSQHTHSTRPGQKDFAKRLLLKYGWTAGQGLGAQGDGITTALRHVSSTKSSKAAKRKTPAAGSTGASASAAAASATTGGAEFAGHGIGRIVGGTRKRKATTGDESGDPQQQQEMEWSIVARVDGMLAGLEDVDAALENGDLMQVIGERMAQFGVVERLYIDRSSSSSGGGGEGSDARLQAAGNNQQTVGEGQTDASQTLAVDRPSGPNVLVKFTSALSAYRAIQAAQAKDFLGNGRITSARFWNADDFEAGVYS